MYVILNTSKDGKTKLFVAHHQLENGSWRSKNIEDARRFISEQQAQNFINKMIYPSKFEIIKID